MSRERDPREDPRIGDCVFKPGSTGPVRRYVVHRHGNQVLWRSAPGGEIKTTWLTTWCDWARGADIGDGPGDPLPVPAGAVSEGDDVTDAQWGDHGHHATLPGRAVAAPIADAPRERRRRRDATL